MKQEKQYLNVILLIFAVGVVISLLIYGTTQNSPPYVISYTEFREHVKAGQVSKVVFNGQQIDGTFDPPLVSESTQTTESYSEYYPYPYYAPANPAPTSETTKIQSFRTYLPPLPDNELLDILEQKKVTIETRAPNNSSQWITLLNWAPILIIALLIFQWMRRRSVDQSEGVTSMLQSRAKLYDKQKQKVTFQDVAGLGRVKQELQEVIEFLQNPWRFQNIGATMPKGILLVGPPGTGKTLLARAVAGEASAAFFPIGGSDFMELFVGVGASRVRHLFKQARANEPAIIFIDELDSIGRRRGVGFSGGSEEREQTLNQLLSEMDGFEKHENIIVMAATNRPDILDAALLRPGRFDRQIVVDSPTFSERLAILQVHGRNKPFSRDVDLENVARGTPGFSGADLFNLLNEAALLAVRRRKTEIGSQEINDAADKVTIGLERELVLTADEKRLLACHEAGHAAVAALLPNTDPIHKVTIIPRGRAMGVTQQLPERDRYLFDRKYILDRLTVLMSGRAAEEVVFGVATSGAADDLKQATRFARRMVLELGMSDTLGHISLRSEQETSFLGDDWSANREYSELTAQKADQEISQILETAYQRARDLLVQHREALDRITEALLEREQLLGSELMTLLNNVESQPVQPRQNKSSKHRKPAKAVCGLPPVQRRT
jgi:cell division protease FtsH